MPSSSLSLRVSTRGRSGALANLGVLVGTALAWLASFPLMCYPAAWANCLGVLLCAEAMILAAYLVHEAAHNNLFVSASANHWTGEATSFLAGASYASFERIRHLHIRHHVDRADLVCFDLQGLLRRHAVLTKVLMAFEWAYIPAVEMLMHLQVIVRPFIDPSQRAYLPRVLVMLLLRGAALVALGLYSPRGLLLYVLAVCIQLHVLNFFDSFHHSFKQFCVARDEPVPPQGDRAYEQANTYSNLISVRHSWADLLILNFSYHNAHHHRPSVPWWRLPDLHRTLYPQTPAAVLTVAELLRSWHRHRVRRVCAHDYGAPGTGADRAEKFLGAHGVSFLTVI